MKERLIKQLDDADLFLRNRANAKPDPLNKYDIAILKDIAETCDKAARALERAIVPPCKVGDMVFVKYYGEIVNAYVTEFEINSKGIVAKVYIDPDTDREYDAEDIFLAKEEAEQALKGGEG